MGGMAREGFTMNAETRMSQTGLFLLASAGLVELDKILPGDSTPFSHYMLLVTGGMFLARLWDKYER